MLQRSSPVLTHGPLNLAHNGSAAVHAPSPRRPGTVLVVDDELPVRTLLAMVLQYLGYEVLSADCAHEALVVARAWKGPRIDLLITDLTMPGTGGEELARELGGLLPNLKVIFSSGFTADDPDVRGLDLHNALYLPKPASARSLQEAIGALFAPVDGVC